MNATLTQKIEGILFYLGEAVSILTLSEYLNGSEQEIRDAVRELQNTLETRGVQVITHNDKVTLVTHPNVSESIRELNKRELEGPLSKAAQEVLSIVLYAGPISKGYIDYIRGVNSSISVRNLVSRGLIEKKDQKSRPQYVVTTDFLISLGLSRPEDIPEHTNIREKLISVLQLSNKE